MTDQDEEQILYRRVAGDLKRSIQAGEYLDRRLPSEHELTTRYGVSRGTVRQAFALLREEGVLASHQGSRRIVVGSQVQDFNALRSFSAWAKGAGSVPGARLVSLESRDASEEEAAGLQLAPGAAVQVMVRVRLLDGRPVMVERTTFPEDIGQLLAGVDLEAGSITSLLEQQGVRFDHAEHVLSAVAASAEDGRLLAVPAGRPLLRTLRLTRDQTGKPVELSDDRYLSSAVAFSVHNSVAANSLSRRPQEGLE